MSNRFSVLLLAILLLPGCGGGGGTPGKNSDFDKPKKVDSNKKP